MADNLDPNKPTPNVVEPKTVGDLFERLELIEGIRAFGELKPGTLDANLIKAIDDDEAAIDDQIAAAIQADSQSKGGATPEVILRNFSDGSTGLYTFNPTAEAGKHLVVVFPVEDFDVPLQSATPSPSPAPNPVPAEPVPSGPVPDPAPPTLPVNPDPAPVPVPPAS